MNRRVVNYSSVRDERKTRPAFARRFHFAHSPRAPSASEWLLLSPLPLHPSRPVLFSADENALIAKITEVDVDTNTPFYRFFIENFFPSSHTRAHPLRVHSELHSQSERSSFRHRAIYRFADAKKLGLRCLR